jgi:hypothetical protein
MRKRIRARRIIDKLGIGARRVRKLKILMKSCPRCRGDIVIEDDDASCLQCGYSPPFLTIQWDEEKQRYRPENRKGKYYR